MKNLIVVLLLVVSTGLFASDADGSGTQPTNTGDDDGNKAISCFLTDNQTKFANEVYRYQTADGTVVCIES
ncbi:hypothetical protein [Marinicella sp. W31]|uniref:hypothetical protein n=1 Tax=Marinicella sp. W31 TaxID=3023713 RepID=UPI003757354F